MITIKLVDARRGLHEKCRELFSDRRIADQIYEFLCEGIEECAYAEPERKHGTWKGYNGDNPDWQRNDGSPIFLTCSECCGTVFNNGSGHWNYCPNCGADMREGEHE